MNRPAPVRFDWGGFRADVVDRLDRRSLGVAAAWVAGTVAVKLVTSGDGGAVASYAMFKLGMVMLTLAILAMALAAVARGLSAFFAYPAAALAIGAIGSVLGVVFDPWGWLAATPPPPLRAVVLGHLYFLSVLLPFALLYVYASNAMHDEKVLRAVEAERAAEAERLARQRLQIELATVDHDLVLKAMRLALAVPERAAGQAEALLESVTSYLRAAQQRGSSEPGRIATALNELRQACASTGGQPSQQASA